MREQREVRERSRGKKTIVSKNNVQCLIKSRILMLKFAAPQIELPLVARSECDQQLKPEFVRRGVRTWSGIDDSELCAGGQGKDACDGEGGAPLVCLDEVRTL